MMKYPLMVKVAFVVNTQLRGELLTLLTVKLSLTYMFFKR